MADSASGVMAGRAVAVAVGPGGMEPQAAPAGDVSGVSRGGGNRSHGALRVCHVMWASLISCGEGPPPTRLEGTDDTTSHLRSGRDPSHPHHNIHQWLLIRSI